MTASTAAAQQSGPIVIAVLPFEDRGSYGQDKEVFRALELGIPATLAAELSRHPRVRVADRGRIEPARCRRRILDPTREWMLPPRPKSAARQARNTRSRGTSPTSTGNSGSMPGWWMSGAVRSSRWCPTASPLSRIGPTSPGSFRAWRRRLWPRSICRLPATRRAPRSAPGANRCAHPVQPGPALRERREQDEGRRALPAGVDDFPGLPRGQGGNAAGAVGGQREAGSGTSSGPLVAFTVHTVHAV